MFSICLYPNQPLTGETCKLRYLSSLTYVGIEHRLGESQVSKPVAGQLHRAHAKSGVSANALYNSLSTAKIMGGVGRPNRQDVTHAGDGSLILSGRPRADAGAFDEA